MSTSDTIAALATPPVAAARAILRVSGPRAIELARAVGALASDALASSGGAIETRVALAEGIETPATVLAFRAPRSSTGEDVVEFHLPGSPLFVKLLLARLFALGARQAQPGEFTSRAFFNGKLDLSAAEGVVATISASNRGELDAARQLLAGELARRLRPIMDRLAHTLALVEVNLDFSEEDVSFIAGSQVRAAAIELDGELDALTIGAARFDHVSHEPRIVLIGRPNAGKSSLLNALAGHGRAVVSDVAGTTRDALSTRLRLRSGHVTIVDVAGLDDEAQATERFAASIESQMADAARREFERADLVVYVQASNDDRPRLEIERAPALVVRSKADLAAGSRGEGLPVSVMTDEGLDALRAALDTLAFPRGGGEQTGTLTLNARHRAAIAKSQQSLRAAAAGQAAELVAADLRRALDDLGEIIGTVSPDDVLGRIFSGFCIGK